MIVVMAGTTLAGDPHWKRRWRVENGREIKYKKKVKRPDVVQKYFAAAPSIDIHNQMRQGVLSLETALRTQKWAVRGFSTVLGMSLVDSYKAYRLENRSVPERLLEYPSFFLWHEAVTYRLLTNNIGVSSRALRSQDLNVTRTETPETPSAGRKSGPQSPLAVHKAVPLSKTLYGIEKKRQNEQKENPRSNFRYRLRCRVCGEPASFICAGCSRDSRHSSDRLVALCGPMSKNTCFADYHKKHISDE